MRALISASFLLALAVAAGAQEPAPAPEEKPRPAAEQPAPQPSPQPAPQPGPRREPPSLTNVRIDLTLSDQAGSQSPVKKTMTMILGDGERGSVRSRPEVQVQTSAAPGAPKMYTVRKLPLNVDARPVLFAGNKVKLQLTLEYSSIDRSDTEGRQPDHTDVSFSGQLVLDSGRPAVVAQAADPISDRKVTVEVTATVLK